MGKSEGNMVTLEDNSENMFGKVMSWPDSLILLAFEICTRVPMDEVSKINQTNPRDAKMQLAYEIVKIYHGERKAKEAQENFVNTFQKKEIPEKVEEIEGEGLLTPILLKAKMFDSKGEIRRLFEAGAIKDMTDNKKLILEEVVAKGHVYKIGKHKFIKIK